MVPSPTRPEHVEEPAAEVDDPATVTGPSEVVDGPADDGPAGDDPVNDGPADDGPAYDGSAGDGSAKDDEPVIVDDPEEVADPASQPSATDGPAINDDDPAGVAGPAHLQTFALEDPAALGTPAGNTPSAGRDSSILAGVSSPLFPSMPTAVNQAMLIDFMSMWTLLLDGWTRVWLFPMPRPGRQHSQRFLLPEMMTPHPGCPRLHLGLQTDDPGRQ